MQSRKEEIQAKRAKLEEIRRQREQREREFAAGRQSIGSRVPSPTNASHNTRELDSLISSLVGDATTITRPQPATTPSEPARYPGRVNHNASEAQPQDAGPVHPRVGARSKQTLSMAPLQTVYEVKSQKIMPDKVMANAEPESYSKGVQTMYWSSSSRSSSFSGSDVEAGPFGKRPKMRKLRRRQLEREEKEKERIRKEVEAEFRLREATTETAKVLEPSREKEESSVPSTLTTQEMNAVTTSLDFLDFLDRSGKVVERTLHEDYDVLADYRLLDEVDGDDESTARDKRGTRVKELVQFYDEKWSKMRAITDLEFSYKFPELILASYTRNSSAPYEPSGIVQVWNLHMPFRSEYLFHATSDILTAKFHPFHPNLIIGGAYSGQVYLWDTRSRSPMPVQTTPLTGAAHTHPVYSLDIVGTHNAHNIVTTSTDGIFCSWATDMLAAAPQQRLLLRAPKAMMNPSVSTIIPNTRSPFANDLSATCTAFPEAQTTYFLAGTEQGPIHLCHCHDRAGTPAGVDNHVYYRAHEAPVTSLDFHNAAGRHNLGDLMLSTGLDWSIKLWRVKAPAGSMLDIDRSKINIVKPLLEIPRDGAVYDAKWSPARPAVFASVDGAGWLDIWDLNADLEAPVTRVQPSSRGGTSEATYESIGGTNGNQYAYADSKESMEGSGEGRILNKCAWEMGEGRRLAVGGLDGGVTVFEVGNDLCGVESAKAEEWDGVKRMISRLEGVGL